MSTESNKAAIRRIFEIMNSEDYAALDEVCTPAVADGIRSHYARHPMSDHYGVIDDLVAEDNFVAVFQTDTSTHTGEFHGIPATGKRLANRGVTLCRFENGKLTELRSLWDELNHVLSLGATITPPSPE
jgi:predicted ester cyclase